MLKNELEMFHAFDNLCYTGNMQARQTIWPRWAQSLQRLNLDQLAALVLEAAGPLTILLAQVVYASTPLVGNRWVDLGDLLQEPEESLRFAAYLRRQENDNGS
jgi:hypothetical protein